VSPRKWFKIKDSHHTFLINFRRQFSEALKIGSDDRVVRCYSATLSRISCPFLTWTVKNVRNFARCQIPEMKYLFFCAAYAMACRRE